MDRVFAPALFNLPKDCCYGKLELAIKSSPSRLLLPVLPFNSVPLSLLSAFRSVYIHWSHYLGFIDVFNDDRTAGAASRFFFS